MKKKSEKKSPDKNIIPKARAIRTPSPAYLRAKAALRRLESRM